VLWDSHRLTKSVPRVCVARVGLIVGTLFRGGAAGFHSKFIEGAKWSEEGKALDDKPRGVVDEWGHVSTPEGVAMAKELASKEGMMVGPSSGAAIKYALDLACRAEAKDKTIVVVVPSHGIRYGAHPLWAGLKEEVGKALPAGAITTDKEAPVCQWNSSQS